jgi:transcriptional regulator with GAF, ATPase, and Fis domain
MSTSEMIGASPKFRAVLEDVRTVAPADCSVLIRGETGTGKEVIARAIHDASPRRQRRFVAINCAAIPATLLESELFGYERGAFTGALTHRMGTFKRRIAARFCSTKLANCRSNSSPSSCVRFRSRKSNGLGVRKQLESMCA